MCFILAGCSSVFKGLNKTEGDPAKVLMHRPEFGTGLYRASVDVTGNHLSGLLLVKQMPDSSLRIVFSNEIGFKFFDFEFSAGGNFAVHSIIDKMNKKAVIKTLRKDFELVLMNRLDLTNSYIRRNGGSLYHIFPQDKGYYNYITSVNSDTLQKMQRTSRRKAIVEAIMRNRVGGIYDTIGITHRNFNFTIALKRIER